MLSWKPRPAADGDATGLESSRSVHTCAVVMAGANAGCRQNEKHAEHAELESFSVAFVVLAASCIFRE